MTVCAAREHTSSGVQKNPELDPTYLRPRAPLCNFNLLVARPHIDNPAVNGSQLQT
jgi:hypothetical protein